MATAVAQKAAPGSLYGVPGITRPIEVFENNDGIATTLAQATSTVATGIIPFKQTDVIRWWEVQATIAITPTAGTGTIVLGPYFPYQFFGNVRLNMQNQFDTINVENGIDLAIFQSYRPMKQTDYHNVLYTQPRSLSYSAQSNLLSSNAYTNASTSIKTRLELPAGLQFDEFWPLNDKGQPVGAPIPAFVSNQFMSGTARIVQPVINYNPAAGSTADIGPYTLTGNATLTSITSTLNIKRFGDYQPTDPNGSDSPVVFNWQYTRKTQRVSIGAVSQKFLLIPLNGQVLSVYVRLFDPAASAGLGAPIPVTNLTFCHLEYGSGLYRFQDRPQDTQARFVGQHGFLPWEGVLIWDLAIDERGRITNRKMLNTMNTSAVQIELDFTGVQSASSYAVIGVEALTYIQVGS